MIDNEVANYKKKKESSVSKSNKKSKHKHEYKDCLLIDKDGYPTKAKYCTICGKIGKIDCVNFFYFEKLENGRYVLLPKEEVFKKYKDLEKFHVKSAWEDKYVGISKGE